MARQSGAILYVSSQNRRSRVQLQSTIKWLMADVISNRKYFRVV